MQRQSSSQRNQRVESKQEPSFSLPYLEMYGMRMIGYACRGGESRRERDNTDKFSHRVQHRHSDTNAANSC